MVPLQIHMPSVTIQITIYLLNMHHPKLKVMQQHLFRLYLDAFSDWNHLAARQLLFLGFGSCSTRNLPNG
jgi:hypothetical protein